MSADQVQINASKQIAKQMKHKANDFLNSRKNANNLLDIINHFEECCAKSLPVTSSLLTLEIIFTELLKRREMYIEIKPLKPKDESCETKYKEWLLERYRDTWSLLLKCFESQRQQEGTQALATSMKLMSYQGKYPIDNTNLDTNSFPKNRFKEILTKLLPTDKSNSHLIGRFKEYCEYFDIVYYAWKIIPSLTPKGCALSDSFAHNYLQLINAIPVTKQIQDNKKLFCIFPEHNADDFDYQIIRKCINKAWNCVMLWEMKEPLHRQVLTVLLERILPHLEKPVLLTDFLMDSLDIGGPIGLLALQGVFTLTQRYNLSYPAIYVKLYSMFEPEIFHTKLKPRLFYLADVFLSSTHLPENLVAAFVKRLARLSLIATPQDIIIILYFIGNLIIRHPGLKRMICHPTVGEVSRDPYIMDEREPTKSNALESSLWEIVTLQSHALPEIAAAARFISQPFPSHGWDLSEVLEVKEDDVFDKEIAKQSKEFALNFDRNESMFLPKHDKLVQYWKLY